jgi:hypothetical protein
MSKWIVVFTMNAQVHCFALQDRIGPTPSAPSRPHFVLNSLTLSRIKAKLRNGDMIVSGDHWPIFLYAGHVYDPEDPWKGLFKSQILVSVSHLSFSSLARRY